MVFGRREAQARCAGGVLGYRTKTWEEVRSLPDTLLTFDVHSRTSTHIGKRLHHIDALRGLASLAVAWFHFTKNGPTDVEVAGAIVEFITRSGAKGWLGVEVFFVISGFILPYTMHKAGCGTSVPEWSEEERTRRPGRERARGGVAREGGGTQRAVMERAGMKNARHAARLA